MFLSITKSLFFLSKMAYILLFVLLILNGFFQTYILLIVFIHFHKFNFLFLNPYFKIHFFGYLLLKMFYKWSKIGF